MEPLGAVGEDEVGATMTATFESARATTDDLPCAWCNTPVPQRQSGRGRKRRYCLPPKTCQGEARRDRMARRSTEPADSFRTLAAIAADALDRMEKQLIDNGARRRWRSEAQLTGMRTCLRIMEADYNRADNTARAGSPPAWYLAEVCQVGWTGQERPTVQRLRTWTEFLAFLTDKIDNSLEITVRRIRGVPWPEDEASGIANAADQSERPRPHDRPC